MNKKRIMSRRAVLGGLGATLALPFLEGLGGKTLAAGLKRSDPSRFACFYIPGAISQYKWFPQDAGTDYTLANGTLTINAGATSGTITIAGIVDDGNVEGNETVILTLSNPSNATVGSDNVHTFTILEPVVGDRNIAFANATSNGSESASSKDLTIQMSASTANDG